MTTAEEINPPGRERRPSRERTVQPGPRCTVLVAWMAGDVAVAAIAAWWGFENLKRGDRLLASTLFGAAAILVVLDLWRLRFLVRARRLVSKGRIEQAEIVSVRKTRMSLRPRADAPSPTGGWPIVPACEVSYAFRRDGGRPVRGAFVVATKEAEMFVPGEDIEVFVDRRDARKLIPSLVARWYFRVSSRMLAAADDPEWDFTNPPPPEMKPHDSRG